MRILLNPRLRRPGPDVRIARLLVVAGPSASGKSTFLGDLARGRLPEEVARALPLGAPGWPQTNGRRMIRRRLPAALATEDGRLPGLVLHYDFLRPFESAIADYASDPSLAVLRWADEVCVAMIAMPRDDLVARLAARPPKARPIARTFARVLNGMGIETRRKLRRVYDPATEHARHRRLVELYRTPDFLAAWETRWLAFFEGLLGEQLRRPFVWIGATPHARKDAFHLLAEGSPCGRHDPRLR